MISTLTCVSVSITRKWEEPWCLLVKFYLPVKMT